MKSASTLESLEIVLDGLMRRYRDRVPDVGRIVDAMVKQGMVARAQDIENDHIAFRTLSVPQLGIQSFEKIFLHYGYQKRDAYHFAAKKLDAFWYSPPEPHFPRIFVSELRVSDLSLEAQHILHSYVDEVLTDPVDSLNLDDGLEVDTFLHTALWRLPNYGDYKALLEESEYAAWVIYNRYYLNHFTVSVHNLPAPFDTVAGFNTFIKGEGIQLNDAGGEIKRSPDGGLLQSSTVAGMLEAEFSDGFKHPISGSYVEFAERRVLAQFSSLTPDKITRAHRREGFEAANADKIFESTYSTQTQKNAHHTREAIR